MKRASFARNGKRETGSRKRFFAAVALCLLAAPLAGLQAGTTYPEIISYQGLVKEAGARPTGTKTFRFKLYDDPSAGSMLWDSTDLSLSVSNGLYSVLLGGGGGGVNDPIPASVFEGNNGVYLEITYESQLLSPRERLVASAYALTAKTVTDGSITAAKLATNVAWKTDGNGGTTPGTHFVGTTDNQALEVKVNSVRALRIEPHANCANIIGGHPSNSVTSGAFGAAVSGGGSTGANANRVTDTYGTVGGGQTNRAGNDDGNANNATCATVAGGGTNTASGYGSTISGGINNTASGGSSTVAGGASNTASGPYATVCGGGANTAGGWRSFAAGYHARALHDGTFVWADSSSENNFDTTARNQFYVRASGGVKLYSNSDCSKGVELAPGSTTWGTLSDRNRKKNFRAVNGEEVLAKIAALPVTYWNYDDEQDSDVPHIGPVAQDLIGAFYAGRDDKRITTLEADGVHFAAIKALEKRTADLKEENARLRAQNGQFAQELAQLKTAVAQLQSCSMSPLILPSPPSGRGEQRQMPCGSLQSGRPSEGGSR